MTYPPQRPGPPPNYGPPAPQYRPPYQQQYRPAQYGPPRQSNARRNLVIALCIGAVAAVAVLVVVLVNVLGKPDLISQDTIQSEVQTIMDQHGIDGAITNLECPEMEAEKGAEYTCLVDIDGNQATVKVTVQDDKGNYLVQLYGY